ncbi:MAG: hypothetical protein HY562_13175, partial [Ignavibacteriales bacterium]|nr:hypothetical protein [Ignavibacteriales bacterium]
MNILNFLLFFLFALSILAVGYGYVAWRMIVRSSFSRKWKNIGWISLCTLFVLPMLAFILNISRAEGFWFDVFSWVGYVSLGFFSMVFTLTLARDLVFF